MAQGEWLHTHQSSGHVEFEGVGNVQSAPLATARKQQSEQATAQDPAPTPEHQTQLLTFKALLLANKVTHKHTSHSQGQFVCKKSWRVGRRARHRCT